MLQIVDFTGHFGKCAPLKPGFAAQSGYIVCVHSLSVRANSTQRRSGGGRGRDGAGRLPFSLALDTKTVVCYTSTGHVGSAAAWNDTKGVEHPAAPSPRAYGCDVSRCYACNPVSA